MKIVVELADEHMPFVRQQADRHGPETKVSLDFEHFPALLPGLVVGVVTDEDSLYDKLIMAVEPL